MDLIGDIANEELGGLHNGLQAKVKQGFLSVGARWPTFLEDLFELLDVVEVVNEARVLLVLEGSLDLGVALPQEHDALLLAVLGIVLLDLVVLLFHFFLQVIHILILNFSNSYF